MLTALFIVANDRGDLTLPNELILKRSSIQNLKLIAAGIKLAKCCGVISYHFSFFTGNFDRVYRGTFSPADGKSIEVTVKGYIHKTEREKGNFQNEMVIMSRIMHPNIVRLYGIIAHGKCTVVYSDFGHH